MNCRLVAGSLLLLVFAGITSSAGQVPTPAVGVAPFPPGELVERVTSIADSQQSYAVYLPSRYRAERRWPILLVMDPRGRALVPMRLVRRAAERRGYIVLSSYNSRSDGPLQPNIDALNAMLADVQRLLSIDTRRFYIVGFSGTARAGWDFALELQGHVAGLIGFGAGLPPGATVPVIGFSKSGDFAFFGGAGTVDFNFEEVRRLATTLAQRRVPHHMEYYDGPHGWPPEAVMVNAVDWMELQAVKRGLVAADSASIDSEYTGRLAEARALEGAGRLFDAYGRYQAIVEDFRGIHPVVDAEARSAELARSDVVRRTAERFERIGEQRDAYVSKLWAFFERFSKGDQPPRVDQALKQLQIPELKRSAATAADSIDAQAAQRLLEQVFVFTSFYQPRAYLDKRDGARALALLAIAEEIRPNDPGVCYNRARALVLLARWEDALSSLECMLKAGTPDLDRLEADSSLGALREDPRFRALISKARPRELSPPSRRP